MSSAPFEGVRVLEFCQIAAGPFCGMLLADQGADVIKIESPDGDGMRGWPPITHGTSENFAALNRNKRSVVLDLKSPEKREAAQRICRSADVILENFRPGVMSRLGLGYESLSRQQPHLVYCSISAYGQSGPRAGEGGFDVTLQAMAGVMSVTGETEGPPVKCGVPLTDFAAGLYAAYAVSSALYSVRSGGQGVHIDVPMLGTTLAIAALQTSEYFGTGRDPVRLGSAHPRNAPYQGFACRNGHIVLAAGTNELFRRTCACLGLSQLADDERFKTTALRAANQGLLKQIIEDAISGKAVDECLSKFRQEGIPCAPINAYSDALADPQVAHYGWVQEIDFPGGLTRRTFGSPLGKALPIRRRPPTLGEHTEEILAEFEL
jgi:crotonobetainyl-CoA:carnitine CoA-transferase CaiB-like acyl-CoA transferase